MVSGPAQEGFSDHERAADGTVNEAPRPGNLASPDTATNVSATEVSSGNPDQPYYRDHAMEHAPCYVGPGNMPAKDIAPRGHTPRNVRLGPQPPVTCMRVIDDFGAHIEIRVGEALILGPLMDDVLEQLKARRANED